MEKKRKEEEEEFQKSINTPLPNGPGRGKALKDKLHKIGQRFSRLSTPSA